MRKNNPIFRRIQVAVCVVSAISLALAAELPKSREEFKLKYVRPAAVQFPKENLHSKEKDILGKTLFFDPRLSASGWISCATCHNPGLAWGDGLPRGIGHGMKQLGRRTPTILNTAWADSLFWDGRAESLEEQALGPIGSPGEMAQDPKVLIAKLNSIPGYVEMFGRAFPGGRIEERTIGQAIATFERGIVSGTAPFDEWIGGNENAISEEAKTGFDLFNGKAHCAKCHVEWNFTDNGFYDIGIPGDDIGRHKIVPLDTTRYAFKTPTLRNVDRRGPYMHDGSEATLEKVIELYDKGGIEHRPSLSKEIKKLDLSSAEKHAVIAFLKTLTSQDPQISYPDLPR